MEFTRKNRVIFLNKGDFEILSLIQNGAFGKYTKLMDKSQIEEALKTGYFQNEPMPYPFIFAPASKENIKSISGVKSGEILDLIKDNDKVGELKVDSSFEIDLSWQNSSIFSFEQDDKKLGKIAISGEFKLFKDEIAPIKNHIQKIKKELNVKKITALMMSLDPLHRVHERLIRMTIDKADMIMIFLIENAYKNTLSFELRKKCLEYFANKFLPRNKLIIVPIENSYIFTSHKFPQLECIVAKNFGATKFVIGQNHGNLGMYFDNNQYHTLLDHYKKELDIEILVMAEYVYCNRCRTIVSTKTCPHGSHHHIKYHTKTLRALLNAGIMPPAILMRKEISSLILSTLHTQRFENLQEICNDLFPNKGILEHHSNREFYEGLMSLYQTSSLT
ncbi:MAG: sulfate adenylyltransferase [Campylobacter sp.]|nr:sulfate adenylyltransferase [Campylobacter sp.]